ncbi:hypothetical protein [Actinomadura kijaniata]|nr:hypothetical protein [Actinomadura kijaniata]
MAGEAVAVARAQRAAHLAGHAVAENAAARAALVLPAALLVPPLAAGM